MASAASSQLIPSLSFAAQPAPMKSASAARATSRERTALPLRTAADFIPYCLTYGRPTAAGGIDRPIRPTSATSVSTYGSVEIRFSEMPASRWSGMEMREPKPKSRVAAKARSGEPLAEDHRGERDVPAPGVMFSVNVPTKPIERNAPPRAASIPEVTTEA